MEHLIAGSIAVFNFSMKAGRIIPALISLYGVLSNLVFHLIAQQPVCFQIVTPTSINRDYRQPRASKLMIKEFPAFFIH